MLHKLGVAVVACSLVLAVSCGKKSDEEQRSQPSPPAEQQAERSPQGQPAQQPPAQQPPAQQPAAQQPPQAPSAGPREGAPAQTLKASPGAPKAAPVPEQKPSGGVVEPAQPAPTAPAAAPKVETPVPQAARPAAPPAAVSAQPKPPARPILLSGAPLGAVKFEHAKHKVDCQTCHHPSREPKAASAPQQACTGCHTKPPQPGMKTGKQAAFHNPTATAGTCIDCHRKSGGDAPTKCTQCHRKENG